MTTEIMEEILAKYFSEEVSEEEKATVEKWRGESEENAKSFMEAKYAWLCSEGAKEANPMLLQDILSSEDQSSENIHFIMQPWVKYASAAVLILALGLLFVLNQLSESVIPKDVLSDGTEVFFHESSSLSILQMDENERKVEVTGKVFFDVARDESRPFTIVTKHAEVVVLGTSFLVDTYAEKTKVTVTSGRVKLLKDNEIYTELEPGEVGLVSPDNMGIIKKPNSDLNYLAWKSQKIIFQESSLQEVSLVLQDVYGVNVLFENPSFAKCRYTATLEGKKLKDVLEIISRTFNVSYKQSKDEVIFSGKGC